MTDESVTRSRRTVAVEHQSPNKRLEIVIHGVALSDHSLPVDLNIHMYAPVAPGDVRAIIDAIEHNEITVRVKNDD